MLSASVRDGYCAYLRAAAAATPGARSLRPCASWFPRSAWEPLDRRSAAILSTWEAPTTDAERRKRGSHAERGNQEGAYSHRYTSRYVLVTPLPLLPPVWFFYAVKASSTRLLPVAALTSPEDTRLVPFPRSGDST